MGHTCTPFNPLVTPLLRSTWTSVCLLIQCTFRNLLDAVSKHSPAFSFFNNPPTCLALPIAMKKSTLGYDKSVRMFWSLTAFLLCFCNYDYTHLIHLCILQGRSTSGPTSSDDCLSAYVSSVLVFFSVVFVCSFAQVVKFLHSVV